MIIDFHVEIGDNLYYETSLNVEELIKYMENLGISYTVVTPAYGTAYIYDFDEANRGIYEICKKYRGLLGVGTVNPWYKQKSLTELEKIFRVYGFKGLKLIPYLQGFSINHKIVYYVIEYLAREKAFLYIPSGYHPQSPLEIADLADMFPDVNIVMGFAGFTDFWMEVLPAMKRHSNTFADISCQSNVRALKEAIKILGSDRFLFASSLPYSDVEVELEKLKLLELSETDKENILWRNAKKLLKI
jgi:predicted TIM-barrel fold metal-dependent hydrolase